VNRTPSVVMTAAVIEELSGLGHTRTCCRRAEVATLLRFAGAVHVVARQVVISAEVDGAGVAGWLRKAIRETFGYPSDVRVLPSAVGHPSGARYLVRVLTDGAALGRQTGLLDLRGRPIRGLPPHVVAGRVCDAEAVWRAAFLARGSLTDRSGSPALEVSCPTPEAAMALVGAARRLGITAKAREVRGSDRVLIRGPEGIGALLTRIGAPHTRASWEERRMRRTQARANTPRLPPFDDANLRRAATAAATATARAERALQILGAGVPAHLAAAATLRVTHRGASLEKLGQLADPPMTKDAMAGRLRRLLALADHVARNTGVPDTNSALPPT